MSQEEQEEQEPHQNLQNGFFLGTPKFFEPNIFSDLQFLLLAELRGLVVQMSHVTRRARRTPLITTITEHAKNLFVPTRKISPKYSMIQCSHTMNQGQNINLYDLFIFIYIAKNSFR